jgi:two-component system NarL family sensor kinase
MTRAARRTRAAGTAATTAPAITDPDVAGPWVDVAGDRSRYAPDEPPRWWRLVGGVVVVAVLVFVGVAAASVVTARRAAEREAVNDALSITDVLARSVLQPALQDGVTSTDPAVAGRARTRLDAVVRARLLSADLVRVKVWTPSGRIVYSDQPQLVGDVFPLDDEERGAISHPATKAEVSDLSRPENRFERGTFGKLLEVYRPVWTPSNQALLFETYSRYDAVTERTTQLWRGFGGITLTSLLLLLIAQAPLTWALVSRIRRAQAEREAWLAGAVSASDEERRRIAATLHDGAVQELAASAFLVAGAADRARATGDERSFRQLDLAAGTVRTSIGGLRSLLVDIYPPSLRTAGLAASLRDLVAPLRSRDVEVGLEVPDGIELPAPVEALIFRVAQECLRNVARHADAGTVRVALDPAPDPGPGPETRMVRLEIVDDGIGFDPGAVLAAPPEGHFGLRLMADQAAAAGADLKVRSAPGQGTAWRLEVPLT